MPAPTARAAIHKQKARGTPAPPPSNGGAAQRVQDDQNTIIRLHITPLTPALLKVYLAPSVLALAQNISYHAIETFPEKGFGYIELPTMEATRLKKKLNGSTLKGSKVRIEDAKPEKRKVREEADATKENNDAERPQKRAKKDKKRKEDQGVLEGVELPDDRKVKRGWTEPPAKSKKEKKERKDKDKKQRQKESKYTKEPELLFKAKLTPVAATEVSRKERSKDKDQKKKKKDKNKSRSSNEVIVHEFEKSTKTPSFIKTAKVSTDIKPAVDYVDGKGWVDEDGNVVEAERAKVKNRRVLELVEPAQSTIDKKPSATPSPKSSPAPKSAKDTKKTKKVTSSLSSSQSEEDESSVVSSSSEDPSSESEEDDEEPTASSVRGSHTPEVNLTPSSAARKEVHPLEALFKRSKPSLSAPGSTSTPVKGLAPINTSFSFFDNEEESLNADGDIAENPPVTPFTQRDLEWRGLRSAAPTPDTAAIGRRFSFPWRNNSQEADDDDDDNDDEDIEAGKRLNSNTVANSSANHLPDVAEEDEEGDGAAEAGAEEEEGEAEPDETPESEFRQWFWENQGNLNRAWKKRRRDALKSKRLTENRRAVGARRASKQA